MVTRSGRDGILLITSTGILEGFIKHLSLEENLPDISIFIIDSDLVNLVAREEPESLVHGVCQ